MRRTLYWFTHDLRCQDNAALARTLASADEVAFVYVLNPADFTRDEYGCASTGATRKHFIYQSLQALQSSLYELGYRLWVISLPPEAAIEKLVVDGGFTHLACAEPVGWYERQRLSKLRRQLPTVEFLTDWNSRLFDPQLLDTSTIERSSFSKFRKQIESREIPPLAICNVEVPQGKTAVDFTPAELVNIEQSTDVDAPSQPTFTGGEAAAHDHLERYFSSPAPLRYKATRNALSGFENSTKFSPYLANGLVSAAQIWHRLKQFEAKHGANESTYWIGFELLWREYFHCLEHHVGASLYTAKGLNPDASDTTFDHNSFQRWCDGETGFEMVDACMRELNQTGYLSNRGRQIVASCLVHELQNDWRYGAAYFQQQLIDYDVAVNWGNWQYIAGVGTDPRGGRHFSIVKQTELYDPDGTYRSAWL